jgi:hypothetical protein
VCAGNNKPIFGFLPTIDTANSNATRWAITMNIETEDGNTTVGANTYNLRPSLSVISSTSSISKLFPWYLVLVVNVSPNAKNLSCTVSANALGIVVKRFICRTKCLFN